MNPLKYCQRLPHHLHPGDRAQAVRLRHQGVLPQDVERVRRRRRGIGHNGFDIASSYRTGHFTRGTAIDFNKSTIKRHHAKEKHSPDVLYYTSK